MREEIRALRAELATTETMIRRAKSDGDQPFFGGEGVWGEPPPGVAPWNHRSPTGDEMLESYMAQKATICAELERRGEMVE